MDQSKVIARTAEICREFDARVIEVGLAIARLELAKALAEAESRPTPFAADGEKPSEILERVLRVSEETRKRLNKRKFPRR